MTIDIFIEEKSSDNVIVYFVQLGCVYNCDYNNLNVLCDNIVRLYLESNSLDNEEIDYYYLPISTYNSLYKKETKKLFEVTINEKINYIVNKVC